MKTTMPAWLPVFSRTLAALLGGYLFTYAFTAALAQLLPLKRVDALVISSLLSFAVYTSMILWAFMARTAFRAWAVVALAVPLAIIGFWPHVWERLT